MEIIKSQTLLKLSDVGINRSRMKFKNVSLQSDKVVCVRDEDKISIVDIPSSKLADLKTKVDSAIIHPSKYILGLKSGGKIQVFDLSKKIKLRETLLNDQVDFWQWVNDKTIGIVTARAVYHWTIPGNESPTKQFNREPFAEALQIISYRVSKDQDWLLLGGIFSENNAINGVLQLYSKTRSRSQLFRGSHAGCFSEMPSRMLGRFGDDVNLFCFTTSSGGTKVNSIEVGAEKSGSFRSTAFLQLSNERDFVVSLQTDDRHGFIFAVTKMGQMVVSDVEGGSILFSKKVSESTIFSTSPYTNTGGIVTVSQDGSIQLFTFNESYFTDKTVNTDPILIGRLSARLGVEIDPETLRNAFEATFARRDFVTAAKIAHNAPNKALRTPETVRRFASIKADPGSASPLLQYFSQLLKTGKLTDFETVELVKPILTNNGENGLKRIENWLREDKLTASEEFGDVLMTHGKDAKLACAIYLRSNCAVKAIDCFIMLGQFDKINRYAKQQNIQTDSLQLLRKAFRLDKEKGNDFAYELVETAQIEIEKAVEMTEIESGAAGVITLLLKLFKKRGDRAEDAALQTQLVVSALMTDPSLAESILDSNVNPISHYDHSKVAHLCEKAGLYAKALENMENLRDIKPCLLAGIKSGKLSEDFVLHFFGEMSREEALECLEELVSRGDNEELALRIALKYQTQMSVKALVEILEKSEQIELLYRFLAVIVDTTEDSELVFKFIRAATKTGQMQELRRVCKTNTVLEPQRVKTFLMENELEDPRPLISLCDRFDFVDDLARHLVARGLEPFLEAYVQKMRPLAVPEAVAALLDCEAHPESVGKLLAGVQPEKLSERLDALVDVLVERGRLEMMLPWLESNAAGGSKLPALHNALARVYVENNIQPEKFLATNEFYEPIKLASLLEARDPRLAFTALSRAPGEGDEALLRAARLGGLYYELASLLVERKDEALWVQALGCDDEHRRALIAQVVGALDNSREPEQVSIAVRAFIASELPRELIELLERLVLHNEQDRSFAENKNLQNLLILTAIKAEPTRVRSYLTQLTDYDGPDIAKIAVSEQYRLYEEAFEIFLRFGKNSDALSVLLDKIEDLDRAKDFCEEKNQPDLWEKLGEAYLEQKKPAEGICYFLKANSANQIAEVIKAATEAEEWEALSEYLTMAKTVLQNGTADAQLLFALAKAGRLDDFKAVLENESPVETNDVGNRLMREELYEAAKIFYENTENFSRLAVCLVNLGAYDAAVGAAEKAANTHTWKVVCYACVDEGEFQLAQYCAARVAAHPDQLPDLVSHYEQHGFFSQLLSALEQAAAAERAHCGIFTALAQLYSKHRSSKLMPHLKAFAGRVNVAEVLKTALKYHCWPEAVFLYRSGGQFDRAVQVSIEHSPSCFDHAVLKSAGPKLSRSSLVLELVEFYRKEKPLLLGEILTVLKGRLDDSKAVDMLRKHNLLPLARNYLCSAQQRNVRAANEALIDLYLEEENLKALSEAVKRFDNFDVRSLASKLERHHLESFRAIAAQLYNKIGHYEKGMSLLKADERYDEMVAAASASRSRIRAEAALAFFVEKRKPQYVAAALLECGSLIRPHIALELGWRHNLQEVVMPFLLQTVGDFQERLERLEAKEKERSERENGGEEKVVKEKETNRKILRLTSGKSTDLLNGSDKGNLLD